MTLPHAKLYKATRPCGCVVGAVFNRHVHTTYDDTATVIGAWLLAGHIVDPVDLDVERGVWWPQACSAHSATEAPEPAPAAGPSR